MPVTALSGEHILGYRRRLKRYDRRGSRDTTWPTRPAKLPERRRLASPRQLQMSHSPTILYVFNENTLQ
ncbi:hypothetical protein E2C01_010413 [Portunus trituberculatus]|uniref:Uncharacterized protein n=1 Tax=Portunus trituberculatus TaxID=210409 RepID=A0A5B7D8L4_PORTR|nr:hypothetical protein [Portunus trituberculatus]